MEYKNGYWEIWCPKEKYKELQHDLRFPALLTLSRIINSLRFCQIALLQVKDGGTPSNSRQVTYSFLFASGILYEGLKVAYNFGKYFSGMKSFKEYFTPLLKDKKTKYLYKNILNRFRNKIVFHFDEDVVPSMLENMDFPEYKFVIGNSEKMGDTYYVLSDEIAMNYILSEFNKGENEKEFLGTLIQETTNTAIAFINAAEKLIAEALLDMGWELREKPNGV